MRVAFAGKGGSGKTTVASLFIRRLQSAGRKALVIDSDVNGHLNQAAGLPRPTRLVGREFKAVAKYLEGERSELTLVGIDSIPELGSIPPGAGSRFIRLTDEDAFLSEFAERSDSLWSLTVGGHENNDIGDSCFHTKLNSAELIVHRILDEPSDWVVADTTAGVDSVGTSLLCAYDLFVYIVEPTAKSVGVLKDFQSITDDLSFPVRTLAIPNKIRTGADLDYIRSELGTSVADNHISMSSALRKLEQVDDVEAQSELFDQILSEVDPVLAEIEARTSAIRRDWELYHRTLVDLYRARCEGWWNNFSGKPLDKFLSPDFRYPIELEGANS